MEINTFRVTTLLKKLIALTIANPSQIEIHPPSNPGNTYKHSKGKWRPSLSKPTLQLTKKIEPRRTKFSLLLTQHT